MPFQRRDKQKGQAMVRWVDVHPVTTNKASRLGAPSGLSHRPSCPLPATCILHLAQSLGRGSQSGCVGALDRVQGGRMAVSEPRALGQPGTTPGEVAEVLGEIFGAHWATQDP